MLMLFVIVVCAIGLVCMMSRVNNTSKIENDEDRLVAILYFVLLPVFLYLDVLGRHYRNLRTKGEYGEILDRDWEHELRYFIKLKILPNLSSLEIVNLCIGIDQIHPYTKKIELLANEAGMHSRQFFISDYRQTLVNIAKEQDETAYAKFIIACCDIFKNKKFLYEWERGETVSEHAYNYDRENVNEILENILYVKINSFLRAWFEQYPEELSVRIAKTPIDYEKRIAADLRKLGFNARTTKASGDQGADVLASKDGVSFAIQCKMYSKPVGNKAVQEANAGRDFYKKDYGVVVSNAGFTKSARQAASACGIILLNDGQLRDLLKYVNLE